MVHDNLIIYHLIHELKYKYGYKASLSDNTIDENIFSQVEGEDNFHYLFDGILENQVDGTELK